MRMFKTLYLLISILSMNRKQFFLHAGNNFYFMHILSDNNMEGAVNMNSDNEQKKDVDDLIFQDEDWTPSDR